MVFDFDVSRIAENIIKAPAEMGVSTGAGKEDQITVTKPNDTSGNDNITADDRRQDFVTHYLSKGREHAIHAGELTELAGFRNSRELRLSIEDARAHGDLIISSPDGYFLPERDNTGQITEAGYHDLTACYKRMRSHGISILRSAKYIRRAIKEYEKRREQ